MHRANEFLTSPRSHPNKPAQWALSIVTAPATEPISVSEAKAHMRIDSTADDNYITALITAVRIVTENLTGRSLVTTTWDYFLSDFPCGDEILLRRPKLQSVTSLKYKDTDGIETTWGASNYIVDGNSDPGRIVLTYGNTWPSLALYPSNPISIRYVSGYGAATAVPQPLKNAMFFLVAHLYEVRQPVDIGNIANKIPMTYDYLISHYVVQRWRFA